MDWTEAAAKAVRQAEGDGCEILAAPPSVKQIAAIIRAHAPPQPEWRDRPTCPGLWILRSPITKTFWPPQRITEETLNDNQSLEFIWMHEVYGPIPEPPAQEKPR